MQQSRCDKEVQIDNYQTLHCNRYRQSGGVAYYLRRNASFKTNQLFPSQIEKVIFDILLSKTKSVSTGIFCKPRDKDRFLETFDESSHKPRRIKMEYIYV